MQSKKNFLLNFRIKSKKLNVFICFDYIKKIKCINTLILNVHQFPLPPTVTQPKKTVNRFKQSFTRFTNETVKTFHKVNYEVLILNTAELPLVSNFI